MTTEIYLHDFEGAFDITSGGVGVHLNALDMFATRKTLPTWARGSIAESAANFIVNPYTLEWLNPGSFGEESGPLVKHPNFTFYTRFMAQNKAEYAGLDWETLRFLMAGELGLMVENPQIPIEPGFVSEYLYRAKEQGLIHFSGVLAPEIVPGDSAKRFYLDILKARIDVDDVFSDRWNNYKFSDRFRDKTMIAATHKLGSMIIVGNQLAYEAREMGAPIPPSFKPRTELQLWDTNWRRMFHEPLPTVEELFDKALSTFTKHAMSSDSLSQELIALSPRPCFVKE